MCIRKKVEVVTKPYVGSKQKHSKLEGTMENL